MLRLVDGLVQDYSDPSALAKGLEQSCTKPSMPSSTRVRKMVRRVKPKTHFLSYVVGMNKNLARP